MSHNYDGFWASDCQVVQPGLEQRLIEVVFSRQLPDVNFAMCSLGGIQTSLGKRQHLTSSLFDSLLQTDDVTKRNRRTIVSFETRVIPTDVTTSMVVDRHGA